MRRLQSWVDAADRVSEMLVAPRTCKQWIDATFDLHRVLHSTQPVHIKPRSSRRLAIERARLHH